MIFAALFVMRGYRPVAERLRAALPDAREEGAYNV